MYSKIAGTQLSNLNDPSLYPPLSETTPHKGVEVPPPYAHTTAPSASLPTPTPTPPCRTASTSAPNPCHHPPPCTQPCPNPLPQGHGSGGPAFMAPCVLLAEATCLTPVSISWSRDPGRVLLDTRCPTVGHPRSTSPGSSARDPTPPRELAPASKRPALPPQAPGPPPRRRSHPIAQPASIRR